MSPMRAPLSGTKLKDGRWRVVVTVTLPDGAKQDKTFARRTQDEAETAARTFLFRHGRLAEIPHTVADLIDTYKAEYWELPVEEGGLSDGSKREHGPAYKRIIAFFGDQDVRTIEAPDVARWLKQMSKDPKMSRGRGIQAYRNVLSVLLNYAEELGWIKGNPAKGRKLPKKITPQERKELNERTFKEILQAAPTESLRDLWECLGATGMRPSEALRLRRTNMFRSMDLWFIRGGSKTRAGKKREIPLPDLLADRLSEREDWLFPQMGPRKKDGPHSYRRMIELWKETLESIDMPYTNPYQLRKLAASRWRLSGMPEEIITKLIGHASIEVTDTFYVQLGRERVMQYFFGSNYFQYANTMPTIAQQLGEEPKN